MDWTNVYDEDGGEEFVVPDEWFGQRRIEPRLARLVSRLYAYHDDDEEEEDGDDYTEHRLLELSADHIVLADREQPANHHRRARSSSSSIGGEDHHHPSRTSSYTLRALYYLSINYILGVGCLGVPYAFARSGFLLCTTILATVTLLSYITIMWIGETGIRYECEMMQMMIEQKQNDFHNDDASPSSHHDHQQQPCESSSLLLPSINNDHSDRHHHHQRQQKERHEHDDIVRYEVIDLVGYYLGRVHKLVYQVSLMALMYIGLLAYTQVFCNSIAAIFFPATTSAPPASASSAAGAIEDNNDNEKEAAGGTTTTTTTVTLWPQVIFGFLVLPLSCVELDEQVSVQSVMATVRFVAIFVMVVGSVIGLLVDDSDNNTTRHRRPPYWASPSSSDPADDSCEMSYTACYGGFSVAFSTALFSQLFQHSVPGLLRPLKQQPSRMSHAPVRLYTLRRLVYSLPFSFVDANLTHASHISLSTRSLEKRTFAAALLTTFSLYLLLGTSTASYFGADTRSSVNLNFADFTLGIDLNNAPMAVAILLRSISAIVVMFPALDTISVFPLIAITLGNNLYAAAGPTSIKQCARLIHWSQTTYDRMQMTTFSSSSWWRRLFTNYGSNGDAGGGSRRYSTLQFDERKELIEQSSRTMTIFWRLVAALPPLAGSLIFTDLSFSLLLAGVAGVYVAFFAPSLLQLNSCRSRQSQSPSSTSPSAPPGKRCVDGGSQIPKSVFSGWHSKRLLCYPVLAFASFSLVMVLLQIWGAIFDLLGPA